ncbi:MAG TPA: gliding motility protein GldN, partial [Aquaticitalea sp.]|nr:gliding motility protein GldN [Aquaticitalea sp.]
FWVFYPEVREVLHQAKAFNNKNSSMPFSFDHLLNSRRFNGYMYKEENVYGDREVKDYVADNALMQLLESDRIKEKIRDFEQDMWSY